MLCRIAGAQSAEQFGILKNNGEINDESKK